MDPWAQILLVALALLGLAQWRRSWVLAARVREGEAALAAAQGSLAGAQAAAQKHEANLRLFTGVLPAGLIYVGRDEVYRFSNATYARWQQREVADIVGKTVQEVVPAAFYRQLIPGLAQVWMGKQVAMEGYLPYQDKKRHVRIQMEPEIDEQGRVLGYIALISDISADVQVQRELKAAKEAADAANEAKSLFLTNMSHEIRTPIGVILGFSEILLNPALPSEDLLKAASTIHRNGHSLLALVNDILDLSLVESGHLKVVKARLPLLPFVADVMQQMRLKADKKGLELTWSVASGTPESIQTDGSRLRQILFNLIGNAIKFTDAGHVRVDVALAPGVEASKPLLGITVSDSGIGIDDGSHGILFRPFTQADPSVARRFGGTGLGLNLCRQLAIALGGTVHLLRSEPHRGSEFIATIDPGDLQGVPVLTAPVSGHTEHLPNLVAAGPAQGRVELQQHRILLVEDVPDNQDLLRTMIEADSGAVDLATNGREAIDMALNKDYAVILMDLQMPIMDGYSATVELRRLGYLGPIIALTAHAMRNELERCLQLGFNAYLTKPFSRGQLLATIASAVATAPTQRN